MRFRRPLQSDDAGFSHIAVPLVVILAVAIGGTFLLVASHADSRNRTARPFKPHHYSSSERQTFALATSNYWNAPQRVDQANRADDANSKGAHGNNPGNYIWDINSSYVTCKPGNVKNVYYNKPSDPSIAHVADIGAAVKWQVGSHDSAATKAAAREYNKVAYCKVYWNLAYQYEITAPGYACTVFMHEYGHLLGRRHNDNPDSPMYAGYVQGQGGSPESFDTARIKVISKSLCGLNNGLY